MILDSGADMLFKLYLLRDEKLIKLENKLAEQSDKIAKLEQELTQLKELLKLQQHRRFGKKNESIVPKASDGTTAGKSVTVASHTRKPKRAGRLLSIEHLQRFQQIYDLSEDEKHCDGCQGNLHLIGKECATQVEIIPLRYCAIEHVQMKYGCRRCEMIKTATKPLAPIPKAIAGASVLADVIVNKYQFHQPLYRQSKMMLNEGLNIPDNTLGNWMTTIATALEPIYEALWVILKRRYLQVDETPVKIQEPDRKGYLWTYYAPHIGDNRGLVVFELSETRSGTIATERLKNFNGLLQTDGYSGYAALRERSGIVGIGCFTHARRRFSEVVKITQDKAGIAAQLLEKLKPLYALEEFMRERKLISHTRKRLRQKITLPIIKELYHWLRSVKNSVPPRSKLGQAIQYTLNQWHHLVLYLRHGQVDIDTNEVENKIREVALGRKNWLHIGNCSSGKMHAIFYSLVLSSSLNNINPRVYIHYLLTRVHDIRRGLVDPLTLLPHTIELDILQQFIDHQLAFAKKMTAAA